jgi:hypothetical protein
MYQSDTEMLFPMRVVPALKNLRQGRVWQELVERIAKKRDGEPDTLAFGLMMIRLGGCLSCHADSYRAMRGCTACAQQTISRFKEGDEALLRDFKKAQRDVAAYLEGGTLPDD